MPTTSRDGVAIRYEVDRTAAPEGTVVFLQGVGIGRWSWRWQRAALSERYDVIAPDTRGVGIRGVRTDGGLAGETDRVDRSADGLGPAARLPGRLRRPLLGLGAGYSVEGLAADLEAVLDETGERSVHLVGQGLGGAVALSYARSYDRATSLGLVGTSPGGDVPETPSDVRSTVLDPDGNTDRQRARTRLRPYFSERFVNRNPHLFDRLVEWQLDQGPSRAVREAQWAVWNGFDAGDWLDEVRLPTLVVHGRADRLAPIEGGTTLAAQLAHAECEPIDGAGHLVGIERPDAVNELLMAFFERNTTRT
ncbi:alpha/beta fold hydrolase [Halovivax gelatinilyticus]|uniref:alpha/beta fold hydrolase n=1 Tax=Halovivax gelatinilyticus TaxID=2961597 RepID=UPI0020CA4A47|nr:alpha/beta hydrolase [Halovivax gelatinilyticus]